MQILLILILCTTLKIFSADDYHWSKGYPELTENTVMNDYWQAIRSSPSQIQKNQALIKVLKMPGGDPIYPKQRKEIAAAMFAGADVRTVQELSSDSELTFRLLPDITLKQDISLLKLLFALNKDAYVYEEDGSGEPPIFYAKTVAVAQLLIEHGALTYLNRQEKHRLFERAMQDDRHYGLITLYKAYGLDPMAHNEYNWTLLMQLTRQPYQDTIRKAELLFDGKISHQQIYALIATKERRSGRTVLDIIEEKRKYSSYSTHSILDAFRDFLLQKQQCPDKQESNNISDEQNSAPVAPIPECPICLDPLAIKDCTKTSCDHIFHNDCLHTWTQDHHNCPLCRNEDV